LRDALIIARRSAEVGLPIIGEFASLAREGYLIGYGPDLTAFRRRAAFFVARILQGADPGELPIEQPTTLELAVNLKTAKTLGIELPQGLLLRADEVIE
jgi:putative tryptophan/tyrosine transport system substrate-binding protein